MTPDRGGARYGVHFDELAFAEDLRHASPAGRDVARAARTQLERDGAGLDQLWRCDPEHREGTRLPNWVKTYLPSPGGRWRMIFEAVYDRAAGELRVYQQVMDMGDAGVQTLEKAVGCTLSEAFTLLSGRGVLATNRQPAEENASQPDAWKGLEGAETAW